MINNLWTCNKKQIFTLGMKNQSIDLSLYSLSCKTVNTSKNFWNVYCFPTNQMQDETAKDNRQTATWISHNLTRKKRAGLSFHKKSSILPFSKTEIILSLFWLWYQQRIDMNNIFMEKQC